MNKPAAKHAGLALVLSGPSGVGKTSIAQRLVESLGASFSVSLTTRNPRPGDTPGQTYHFVDRAEFEQRRDAGELLEWAEVFDNYYGTPRAPVDDAIAAGGLIILDIDVEGAIQVKRNLPQAYGVFVLPPSESVLLDRLRNRKSESEAVIQRRFSEAKREIRQARECGAYDDFVVNDDLTRAIDEAIGMVNAALHDRRDGVVRRGGRDD